MSTSAFPGTVELHQGKYTSSLNVCSAYTIKCFRSSRAPARRRARAARGGACRRGGAPTLLTVQAGERVPAGGSSRGPAGRERAAAAGTGPAPAAAASSRISSSAGAAAPRGCG